MEYTIVYTTNKNGYARVGKNGLVTISIPARQKNNKSFENILIEKSKLLFLRWQSQNHWETERDDEVMLFGERVPKSDLPKNLKNFLKKTLLEYVTPLIEHYTAAVHRTCTHISLRHAKSRRGSCSIDGKIMFNLDLVHLDTSLIRYVVVHEVAHLVQHNHSQKFWDQVEELLPEYKKALKRLKKIRVVNAEI